MSNFHKAKTYLKKEGVASTARRSVQYLKRRIRSGSVPLDVMADIEDIINADFINNPYQPPVKIARKATLDIAWVLSPVSPGSGGQNTITRFARFLQSKGHNVTFYIYEGVHPQKLEEAEKILRKSFNLDVTVKSIDQYTDSDAVIATGWETAYPVFNLRTTAHKFYFVQDFEPYFYGIGSRYILAENTYGMGFYGITAGKWLTKKVSDYGMKADHFDFGADLDIYKPKQLVSKKKKICFYARPVTERRAFELGIIALDIFHQKHPDYEIDMIGWDVSAFDIPFPYKNRGILSHSELAELYQESAACLVLSLTNVSLLPLELVAASCVPVVNEGENNSLVLGENKFISYAKPIPSELARALCDVVESKTINETANKMAQSATNTSWDKSYEKVEQILVREICK